MMDSQKLPPESSLAGTRDGAAMRNEALGVMDRHWRPAGYTVPNSSVYPHQWLWDSCFHAVVWARLGRGERAVSELRSAFALQGPDGFVPHMTYRFDEGEPADPEAVRAFWGREASSCITQPPMYGHSLAELHRSGVEVPADLIAAAEAGLDFLLRRRRQGPGGVRIIHPWESGCDDSPRWDLWREPQWSPQAWHRVKGELVESIQPPEEPGHGTVRNPRFEVRSAAFEALVAFNARELATLLRPGPAAALQRSADGLAAGLASRWEPVQATWADAGADGTTTSTARTAEALLPALVVPRGHAVTAALEQMRDPAALASPHGLTGVHRSEPTYDPTRYWRGPVWPQITYLLVLAAGGQGRPDLAKDLASGLRAGAQRSGFSEYWHPDTGEGLGATPQSWTALAAIV